MNTTTDTTRAAAPLAAFKDHTLRNALPALISGVGGFIAIGIMAAVTDAMQLALLIAPFGSSCVLLFALPASLLARPRNVIGGHFLSALVGLIVLNTLGTGVLALAVGVGLAIAVMQFTATVHPPAGANPIVVILTGAGWSFLAMPILAGAVLLCLTACLYHRMVSRRPYPVA
ncbi:HPP family protein [Paracoccus sp. DMF-8]|uniref:HPP family protein n=1 Tax=Paracoccus sp. DMF-8 TaxID=3019445 RepID=UPI0023E7A6C7|nr:HPP family protein [Paracoccus sp. DMF-8]MDF3605617.1 HPP family protein [Paracoccus sp. DMF-8]